MTGAALQALAVVGRKRAGVARRAVAWLRANQNDDGGFGQFRGRDSNAQSTAYAVQGLVAVGAGGGTLKRALAYLRGLQRANGSVAYSSNSNQTPVWVTAQALMALERRPLPIAAVPRQPKPAQAEVETDARRAASAAAQGAKPGRVKRARPGRYRPTSPPGLAIGRPGRRRRGPALELDRAAGEQDDPGPPAWVFGRRRAGRARRAVRPAPQAGPGALA